MKRYFQYLKPQIPKMTLGLIIKFIGTIMDLLLPWILAHLINDVVPMADKRAILLWGAAMVAISVIGVTANIVANRMASRVAMITTGKIRKELFRKIIYLSCHRTDEFTIPSLESRLTTDTYNIHQMTGMMQRLGVRAPILLIGGIIITLSIDPVLSLTLISVLPIISFIVYRVSKKGVPLFTEQQGAVDRMVRVVRENAVGVRVIKALSKSEYEKERFDGVNNTLIEKETVAATVMATSRPLMNLFFYIGLTMVIVVGAFRVNAGDAQAGTLIAFLTYFTLILNAMLGITRIFVILSRSVASANRISEVLEVPEDLEIAPKDVIKSDYKVEFKNVSFSYNKVKNNLENISFGIKKGETLGIIGATGCGKSTVVSLLLRFYDPDFGEIRIDGENVKSMQPDVLHSKFGVVFQNDVVFADSVEENIKFGRELSRDKLIKASEIAQAKSFIAELDGGYEYQLASKGTNVSGGQKQRVLISRAVADDPEILILDDSSSALDYKTDAKLRKALREHSAHATVIIIAQRISSVRNADKIIVMDDGKIVGYGNHDELTKSCELYRLIAQTQNGDLGE